MTAGHEGRVAIVTGAASGIGHAIAERLVAEGALVAIADVDSAGAERAAEAFGDQGLAVACDVSDRAAVDAMVAAVMERWGRLDVLVNNAGIYSATSLDDVGGERFDAMLRVMLGGVLNCCKAAAPRLAESAGARILNIASIEGQRGKPGSLAYGTAKGAVINLTRELACELAPSGINVNAIAPGFIDTPMCVAPDGSHWHDTPLFRDFYIGHGIIPLRRDGKPADIAGPALFLCGPDSADVTGRVLGVDGALSATY